MRTIYYVLVQGCCAWQRTERAFRSNAVLLYIGRPSGPHVTGLLHVGGLGGRAGLLHVRPACHRGVPAGAVACRPGARLGINTCRYSCIMYIYGVFRTLPDTPSLALRGCPLGRCLTLNARCRRRQKEAPKPCSQWHPAQHFRLTVRSQESRTNPSILLSGGTQTLDAVASRQETDACLFLLASISLSRQ